MSAKTIETYTTKGFSNKGVAGSTPVRMEGNKGTDAITPQVMKENNLPSQKIIGSPVKELSVGNGVDSQTPMGKFKGKKN